APQPHEIVAQLKHARFQRVAGGERMVNVRVRLQATPICCLELAEFFGLRLTRVSGKIFINEEIPDFFPALASIQCLKLCVAKSSELFVGCWRFSTVALTHQLKNTFTVIDLLAQNFAQITALSPKNFLPDRLVAEKGQGIRYQLPGAL